MGGLQVKAALLVDPLSMTMVLFVTGVSTLIHLYSIGYMKGDRDYPKFFLYLNLFVASMLILVLADNLLFTFVGWEGVGLCSYWLVVVLVRAGQRGQRRQEGLHLQPDRRRGLPDRHLPRLRQDRHPRLHGDLLPPRRSIGGGHGTAICLLLFVAAVGKSAQIPLFPWLADAMEGPTPVSALIHAATMVTAGVYLLCRISPLLAPGPRRPAGGGDRSAPSPPSWPPPSPAPSTTSRRCSPTRRCPSSATCSWPSASGAYEAAIFLMVAHAFFKALLFLGAGSVIHGLHDEQDLKRMGNLRRYMTLTFVTFVVGWLAIAGIPPLSGFFAKGDVLDNAFARYPALWAVGLVTAALTAYYMTQADGPGLLRRGPVATRARRRPRHGTRRGRRAARVALGDGSSRWWCWPCWPSSAGVLRPARGTRASPRSAGSTRCSGPPCTTPTSRPARSGRSADRRRRGGRGRPGRRPLGCGRAGPSARRSSRRCCSRSYYIDDIYDAVIGRPGRGLGPVLRHGDRAKVIDGAVNGVGRARPGRRRRAAARSRPATSASTRSGIVLGAVVLLAFMLSRAVS